MASIERIHESAEVLPSSEEMRRRAVDGWKLVALVWQREIGPAGKPQPIEEIPYGLMISEDCHHLIVNPAEKEVLMLAMDLIVQDQKISQVTDALNGRGFKTRAGKKWTAADVFNLLPRLIDTGPKVFVSNEWITRHAALTSYSRLPPPAAFQSACMVADATPTLPTFHIAFVPPPRLPSPLH